MKRLLLLTIIALCGLPLQAQTLETNLIELNYAGDSYPKNITAVGDKVFFGAIEHAINYGRPLMVHDKLTGKTYKVKSGNALSISDDALFAAMNGVLYILNDNKTSLWRSDGTDAGTYSIHNFISSNYGINKMAVLNNILYFAGTDDMNGHELWRSDGTVGGTYLVKDINPGVSGSYVSEIIVCNNMLLFGAEHVDTGWELWKSDGTATGTVLLKDIYPGQIGMDIEVPTVMGNNLYFVANNGINGRELWKSDGTTAGTQLFKEFIAGSAGLLGTIYTGATNDYIAITVRSGNNTQLWKADGNPQNTILLKQTNYQQDEILNFDQLVNFNNQLYFILNNWDNSSLWKSDGTPAGTQSVKAFSNRITKFTPTGEFMLLCENQQSVLKPWASDGTTAGTVLLPGITLSNNTVGELKFEPVGDAAYFCASSGPLHGYEFWETKGSAATTKMVFDINHSFAGITGFGSRRAVALQDKMIFAGNNGVNFLEPYVSNGTKDGTFMLKDIIANYSSLPHETSGYSERMFLKAGNNVFFPAISTTTGFELYSTDGTVAGTTLVKDINPGTAGGINVNPYFMEYNGILYFKANHPTYGEELWRTDGTDAGTYLVKDIYAGTASGVTASNGMATQNRNYAIMNGQLYFSGIDAMGRGIWKTDGTTAGTEKIISLTYEPRVLGAINNKLFFANGNTLLSTDGTQNGIVILGVYGPGTLGFTNVTVHNNEFYFGASASEIGHFIIKSDGTTAGTILIYGPLPGGKIEYIEAKGDYIYFCMGNTHGDETGHLWRTDGTEAGTLPIANTNNALAMGFTGYGDKLLFLKTDDRSKLWVTDGNPANTTSINVMVSDGLNQSAAYISNIMGVINDTIYLEANGELCVSNISGVLSSGQDTLVLSRAAEKVVMYPNPTNGLLTLKSQLGEAISSYEIYDLTGKQVMAKNVGAEMATCDVTKLSKGIYLVKVKTAKGTETKKLVRE